MSDLFGNHIVGFPPRRLIYFSFRTVSIMARAFASRAGSRGLDSRTHRTRDVPNGTSGYLVWRSLSLFLLHQKCKPKIRSSSFKRSPTSVTAMHPLAAQRPDNL